LRLEELESRTLLSASAVAVPLGVVASASHGTSVTNVATPPATALTPAQVQQAYGFNSPNLANLTGAGQTIGIVDAYNDPFIQNDVANFSTQFNLPQFNGKGQPTFNVINEKGGSTLPATNAGWDTEISLDVEWAHAIAPGANIVLVEASSASFSDLFTAVATASSQKGVVAVSMSWGSNEFLGENAYDSYFAPATHPGVVFVAASGDNVVSSYPAASPNVLGVGGTTLTLTASGTYGSEVAWDSSGGGLSLVQSGRNTYKVAESEPGYQQGVQNTGVRVSPDVAYNADPSSGFAVYDSVASGGVSGWQQIGGTSAGSPQWAALVALVDQGRGTGKALTGATQLLPALYSLPSSNFNSITTDDSGTLTFTGYNDYTGLGTPVASNLIPALIAVGTTPVAKTPTGTSFAPGTTVHVVSNFITDPANLTTIVLVLNPTPTNSITTNSNLLVIVLTGNTQPPVVPFFGNLAVSLAYAENASPPPHFQQGGTITRISVGPGGRWSGYRRPVRIWGPSEYFDETAEDPLPGAEDPPNVPDAVVPAPLKREDSTEQSLGGPAGELSLLDACFADRRWFTEAAAALTRRMLADDEENPEEDRKKATGSAAVLIALALLTTPCGSSQVDSEKRNRNWRGDWRLLDSP